MAKESESILQPSNVWSYCWPTSTPAKVALAAAAVLVGGYWAFGGSSAQGRKKHGTDFNSYLIDNTNPKKTSKAKKRPQTSFDSYLKNHKPKPAKTDFNAFLINADGDSKEKTADDVTEAVEDLPLEDQVVVTLLFGTEYGFAKEIAEKLCGLLKEQQKYWPQLLDMADGTQQCDLAKEQVILVVCSTQGDGVAPSEAREYFDWLQGAEAPMLPSTHYSVCALGDSSYTHFCACGKSLDARLAVLGGQPLVGRQDVNREDWKAVDQWMQSVIKALASLDLKTVGDLGGFSKSTRTQEQRISKARPYLAEVVAVEGLCRIQDAADKDTIRVELDISGSGLEYQPGDALGIHASNAPQVVSELISYLAADPESIHALPAGHHSDERLSGATQISLVDLLTYCYDLRWPKQELLNSLRASLPKNNHKAKRKSSVIVPVDAGLRSADGLHNGHANGEPGKEMNGHSQQPNGHSREERPSLRAPPAVTSKLTLQEQAELLEQLANSSSEDVEKYFQPRHVIDILIDFDECALRLEELLPCLNPLHPRLYSISSSPLENPSRVQVTVAVVRYNSLQKDRLGVASTLLAERITVGDKLPVYVSKNPDFRLPEKADTPIIMVGPGTGISPFRSFILQRILSGESYGRSILFFGCRRSDQDYLYGDVLEDWAKDGRIQLYTAFSRQQEKKVYVQNRLREAAQMVWEALELGGHFYVCGDAASMAGAVEEALLNIIADHQGEGHNAAESYLERLRQHNRYQRDVWY